MSKQNSPCGSRRILFVELGWSTEIVNGLLRISDKQME